MYYEPSQTHYIKVCRNWKNSLVYKVLNMAMVDMSSSRSEPLLTLYTQEPKVIPPN